MNGFPSVSIVVLNWNGREHVEDCLRSIDELDYPAERLELIFADNGSTDGSVEFVRAQHPRFKILAFERNHGFAGGNDRAAEEATGDWVAFLNNDMEVPTNWLEQMVAPLQSRPGLACIASRILNWNGTAIDFIGGGIDFQGHGLQLDHDAASSPQDLERRLLFACGGAMLVRRRLFVDIGGFDPMYFAFFEDVDLGWRLNLLGHDVWYNPRATVRHRHHGTTARIPAHKLKVLNERNALFTIFKNYDDANLSRVLPVALLLLNDKGLRMAGLDPAEFSVDGASTPPPVPSHHASARPGLITKLRERGIGAAARSARARLRKAAAALAARAPADVPPASTGSGMPSMAASQFAAISEFARNFELLKQRREWVQSRRVRTDSEVLSLCGVRLEDPTYGNASYIDFQHWLSQVAGIDEAFEAVAL